jgi:hypothetical protein
MSATMVAKGLATWIPGVRRAFFNREAALGTGSPAYCYNVWMKHLTLAWAHGMRQMPGTVLELGPGESIGTGVAALLSGARRYIGIDAVAHLRPEANARVFEALVERFRARESGPRTGWPALDPYLDERGFPSHILDDARLDAALDPARLRAIGDAVSVAGSPSQSSTLRYFTWDSLQNVPAGTADFLFSHVVLNQVEDSDGIYARCAQFLAPGGWMTHQIDLTCLNTAAEWNGHRAYGDLAWKVITGNRPYFVNREPAASHLAKIERHGFEVVEALRGYKDGGIRRDQLAPRWRGMSDEDLKTSTLFVIARRNR